MGAAMGEAKRKAQARAKREVLSKPLNPARFNLYALGARRAPTRIISEERSYWSDHDERVLGLVFRDRVDNDYGWMLLARDRVGRFRCVKVDVSFTSEQLAIERVRESIAQTIEDGNIADVGYQGDEPNEPFDLLRVAVGEDEAKLHPFFKILRDDPARTPARAVFKELGPWLAPTDPHFVHEFQFQQFDQRLWELYLWAAFRELGFDIEQPEAPDFLCSAPGVAFTAEATVVSPSTAGPLSQHPDPQTPEELREFLAHYMPMKFGSSLTSKLNKKSKAGESYWDRGETANKPFILAVADFHKPGSTEEPGSMSYTQSALWPYLYGHRVEWEAIEGQLVVRATKNPEHRYGNKAVPSGFFDLPGAENVSAVLFSNAGTLAKFDRMGVVAGFALPGHRYLRVGYRFNPDPNAIVGMSFQEEVGDQNYTEFWSDELQIFHNPNAKYPLPPETFAGITQHFFKEGDHHSIAPEGSVLASQTIILRFTRDEQGRSVA